MSALDTQVGGNHYREGGIQPVQYIEANGLKFLEGCVVKRVTRHDRPTGKGRQDIEKAIHELQLLLELRYPLADIEVRNPAPTRPAWPDDKAYRWMARDADGRWCAFDHRPVMSSRSWVCLGSGEFIALTEPLGLNPNWRGTLIERGADE